MNWQLPREVTGRILSQRGNRLDPTGAPTDFSGELVFNDDTSAGFFCSFLAASQQWVDISGSKGHFLISDFVHPFNDHEPVILLNHGEVRVKCCDCAGEHDGTRKLAQDANMFRNFAAQVRSGKLNEDWPMWALKTQQVTDACFESAKNGGRGVPVG
jgi:predicted dehydrogenase